MRLEGRRDIGYVLKHEDKVDCEEFLVIRELIPLQLWVLKDSMQNEMESRQ